MIPFYLEPYLAAIRALCVQCHVQRLDVFGSVLRDDFKLESDIDFIVVFNRDAQTNAFDQYFDFKEGLSALLGREAELVCYNAIRNPIFKEEVESTRQSLYAA
jgi:predicted nucleotidyltransferase